MPFVPGSVMLVVCKVGKPLSSIRQIGDQWLYHTLLVQENLIHSLRKDLLCASFVCHFVTRVSIAL